MKLLAEKFNIYRAIAELAYAMTMADGIFETAEKEIFDKLIKESFGSENWVAELRFDLVSNMVNPSVEGSYQHAITLIERNKNALDATMVVKLKNILWNVAKVSGVTPEEELLLKKFEEDVDRIYQKRG